MSPPTTHLTPPPFRVRNFSWSVDGVTLAFGGFSTADSGENVFTVFLDGSKLNQITTCASRCSNPQWNPQDDLIAYETDQNGIPEIALTNFDGSVSKVILSHASSPSWSPVTGSALAYVCGTDICVANEDGSNPQNLTNGMGGLTFSSPSWSLDETAIAFLGATAGSNLGDIFVVPAIGTISQWTTTSNAINPQWSTLEGAII